MRRRIGRAALTVAILALLAGCGREAGKDQTSPGGEGGEVPGGGEMLLVVVPAGRTVTVELDHELSSSANAPGDPVQAHVVSEVLGDEQVVVLRPGARADGVVAEVEGAGQVKGRAVLALDFVSLDTVAGPRDVQTAMVDGTLEAAGTRKRSAAAVIGGAAAGAAAGKMLGDMKLGPIIGAVAGAGMVLATRGDELKVEPGTRFGLKLLEPLAIELPAPPRPTD